MRRPVTAERVREFMRSLGVEARENTRLYFAGGATAVLLGWRATTVDLDIRIAPESDAAYRALPELKERLALNVELASPADFIPELPGWMERSRFIAREGKIDFYHYDFYAQVLSKLARGHARDLDDVRHFLEERLVEPERAIELFESIEEELYRFPAIDPPSFRRRVEASLRPA